MSKTIQFSMDDEQHQEMEDYARAKGFHRASDLARYATIQHMRRYPIDIAARLHRTSRAVQPIQPDRAQEEASDGDQNGSDL